MKKRSQYATCSLCGREIVKVKGVWKHYNDGDPETEGNEPEEDETHWAAP